MPTSLPIAASSSGVFKAQVGPSRTAPSASERLPSRAADALVRRLLLARSRWRWVTTAEAILLGLLTALVVATFGLGVATGLNKALGVGPVLLWTAVGPALATTAAMLVHRWRTQRDLAAWAATRAVRHAEVNGELLRSATELARRMQDDDGTQELGSPWLLAATLSHAEDQAQGLDIDAAAILTRCRRYSLWLLGVLLLGAVVTTWSPQTWHSWWTDPEVPEAPPRDVGTLVGDSRLRVEAPAHAAAAVPVREEEGAEATVLRGSQVTVDASALPGLEVEAVEVLRGPGRKGQPERQPVANLPGRGLVWQATLLEPIRYRYVGRDDQRQRVREVSWRELGVKADLAPVAVLERPSSDVEVRPGQTLQLLGQVDDDIGLLQVELVIQRPATGLERRPLTLSPGQPHFAVREALSVDTIQLRPGEQAEIFLEATDANPFDGARKGVSERMRVRMFSTDRQHTKVMDLFAQVADQWALRLADRLELDPATDRAELGDLQRRREAFATEEQKAVDALHELRQQVADDSMARPRSLANLDAIEKVLIDALADEARAMPRSDPALPSYAVLRDVYQLQRHHAQIIAAEEQAVADLMGLAAEEREAALVRESQTLAETQHKLLTTLEKMADSGAKPLQAEAERLLDLVEQQMDRLAQTAQKQARQVPREHVNAQALEPASLPRELADQRNDLGEVRRLLRQGKSREALEKMRQLSEALAQATGDVQRGLTQQRGAADRSLERLAQELRRGLDRAMDAQGRVRDDLRSPAEEQQRGAEDLMRQVRDTLIPQLQEQLAEVRDSIRAKRFKAQAQRAAQSLTHAREAVDAANDALRSGKLDTALQSLQQAQDDLSAARRLLAQGPEAKDAEGDLRRIDAAQERIGRVVDRLREALPEPAELLRPATRTRLAGLAEQEGQLRSTLERLEKRLREAADAHPALKQQVGERLEHATQVLSEAEESLRNSDAQRAFDQTAEILEALRRASDILDQSQQAGPGKASEVEQVGREPGGSAEIRSGNQNDAAERFRDQVMRSMQQPEPGGWHDRLNRYYKAISR